MKKPSQHLLNMTPDKHRLAICAAFEMVHGNLEAATQARTARLNWIRQIQECTEDGMVALCTWSRDCDMCEGITRTLIEATPSWIDARIDRDYECAEGPIRHWIQKPSAAFESAFRDRALEAFEDGHAHIIY